MSARMKQHHIKNGDIPLTIIIEKSGKREKRSFPAKYIGELETFLDKYSEVDSSVSWDKLAEERVAKHTKAGLVLRGARYREDISQKELAKRSGISQENISKIENGKRPVGIKVAKALAKALHIEANLLLPPIQNHESG